MANAILTEDEKARIRFHLGFFTLNAAPSISIGFPRAAQPLFLVEIAMEQIPESAIGLVREQLAQCESIQQEMALARSRFKAMKLGEITLRTGPQDNEIDMLEREYYRWAQRLADVLACPLNIYSERFRYGAAMGGPRPLNVPVRH